MKLCCMTLSIATPFRVAGAYLHFSIFSLDAESSKSEPDETFISGLRVLPSKPTMNETVVLPSLLKAFARAGYLIGSQEIL